MGWERELWKRALRRRSKEVLLAHLGCVVRPPVALATPQAAERQAKKPKALPLSQIDETAFVFVERHMESCQLFAKSLLDRPEPPVMPRMSIN